MLKYNLLKSGWQDSNLRPPAPKAGAMTGLRYTPSGNRLVIGAANIKLFFKLPNTFFVAERPGFEPGHPRRMTA